MKNKLSIITLFVLLQLGVAVRTFAVSEAALLFLLISPSPQANGMGGVFTTVVTDDPMSPIYNPGNLGILAQKNFFVAGFYPIKVRWLPSLTSDLYYTCKAYNFGFNLRKVHKHLPISVGVGYNEIDLDLGERIITGEEGPEPIGTFHSYDRSKSWTFGLAIDLYMKAGIGWSFKEIESNLAPSAKVSVNARDFGVLFQLPILETFYKLTNMSCDIMPGLRPFLIPAFGYSENNYPKSDREGKVIYIDVAQADPFPKIARIGYSFATGLYLSEAKFSNWKMLSFEWGTQAEDILVKRYPDGKWDYRTGLGDIDFFHDLVQGHGNNQIIKMKGWGLNFFEAFYLRMGSYKDPKGKVFYDTEGFGISLGGLFKVLRYFYPTITSDRTIDFLRNHIDIQYNWSDWDAGPGHPLHGTEFHGISFVFR